MNVLVSHTLDSQLLNQALYCSLGERLFLCNDFTKSCTVLNWLGRASKRVSTEVPLYGLNTGQRLAYALQYNIHLTHKDLELYGKILPNCVAQGSRLRIESQSESFVSALALELILYWKAYLLSNSIDKYYCWAFPHQLSDFILYETANLYCSHVETVYQSTLSMSLPLSGSFASQTIEISNKYLDSMAMDITREKLTTYMSKLLASMACSNSSSSFFAWSQRTNCQDPTMDIALISIHEYIYKYFSQDTLKAYIALVLGYEEIGECLIPPPGSVVILLNVEPEATICPMATPFLSSELFIAHIRSTLPEGTPIYLKEHPMAFDPTHRMYEDTKEILGCMARRGKQFMNNILSDPNLKYIPPWFEPRDWIYHNDYYVITLGSTLAFELAMLGKSIAVEGTTMKAFSRYHNKINKFSADNYQFFLSQLLESDLNPVEKPHNEHRLRVSLEEVKVLSELPWNHPLDQISSNSFRGILDLIAVYLQKT